MSESNGNGSERAAANAVWQGPLSPLMARIWALRSTTAAAT